MNIVKSFTYWYLVINVYFYSANSGYNDVIITLDQIFIQDGECLIYAHRFQSKYSEN